MSDFIRHRAFQSAIYCVKDLPANTIITPDYLEVRLLPESRLPANACTTIWELLYRKLDYPVEKGAAFFLADIGFKRTSEQLSVPVIRCTEKAGYGSELIRTQIYPRNRDGD